MTADAPTLTIARLHRVLENHSTSELTMPQYRVLGLLSSGHERATGLASKLAVTKPTLTSLIDGLVERGFVARKATAGDRRAVRIVITPAGRAAADAAGRALRDVLDDVLARCADPGAYAVTVSPPLPAGNPIVLARVNQYGGLHVGRADVSALNVTLPPAGPAPTWRIRMTRPGGGNLQPDASGAVTEVEDLMVLVRYAWE